LLLEAFRSFYSENQPYEMERLVEFFSVFSGSGLNIDIDAPLESQIITHVLDNYGELYNKIDAMILGEHTYAKLLRAVAKGDRRTHSIFNNVHIGESKGHEALDFLIRLNLLEKETSRELPVQKTHPKQKLSREIAKHKISDKLTITIPFLRFWFYFIYPYHHMIIKGDYEPCMEFFKAQQNSYNGFIYEQLCRYLLKKIFSDDAIITSKSYWDRNVEIDILAVTQHSKVIVAECKWTNHKMNKKELSKLSEKCNMAEIEPDYTALFSKRGFSNELQSLKSSTLLLYDASDLELLLH
jgi:hypothetical protein